MKKGKYGIVYPFYAVIAIICAIFGQIIPCLAVTLFVIAAEKDEWTSRQCIQASFFAMIQLMVSTVLGGFVAPANWFSGIPLLGGFTGIYRMIFDIIGDIASVVLLVFLILAIVNVVKEKDANLPFAKKFANWAYGIVTPKPQPQPMQYQQPMQPQPMQQPMQQPVQQSVQQNAAPAQGTVFCPNCGTPAVSGNAFCEKCGTKLQ